VLTLAMAILGFLGWRAHQQTYVWRDSVSLFRHILNYLGDDPYRSDIYYRLGKVHDDRGNFTQAVQYMEMARAIRPDPEVSRGLGIAYGELGHFDLAVHRFNEAIRLDPDFVGAYSNYAVLLARQGNLTEAMVYVQKALEHDPENEKARALRNWLMEQREKTRD